MYTHPLTLTAYGLFIYLSLLSTLATLQPLNTNQPYNSHYGQDFLDATQQKTYQVSHLLSSSHQPHTTSTQLPPATSQTLGEYLDTLRTDSTTHHAQSPSGENKLRVLLQQQQQQQQAQPTPAPQAGPIEQQQSSPLRQSSTPTPQPSNAPVFRYQAAQPVASVQQQPVQSEHQQTATGHVIRQTPQTSHQQQVQLPQTQVQTQSAPLILSLRQPAVQLPAVTSLPASTLSVDHHQLPPSNQAPSAQNQHQDANNHHQQQQLKQQVTSVELNPLKPSSVARQQQAPLASHYSAASSNYHHLQLTNQHHQASIHNSPLYLGHNPFIEILRPHSYADDNIVTLNLSHSHIYEIDSDAFVGQRFEHIDLSNNKLGLIHSRSFRIGPSHSRHNPYNPHGNSSVGGGVGGNGGGGGGSGVGGKPIIAGFGPTRRPPPAHPKSVTIDFSHNPAIVALSGAFDHIDVPSCLLNFTNSTVELKFGAFKKYFKEHPGHIIDIESVDCCEQEWLLGYKHNFVSRTHCDHDPNLLLAKVPQQTIIDSCISYVTSARHSMTIQGPSVIHQVAAAAPRNHTNHHADSQYFTYLILGGTAMILTSLSIYIIFYMFSLKAAFVYQMQNKS